MHIKNIKLAAIEEGLYIVLYFSLQSKSKKMVKKLWGWTEESMIFILVIFKKISQIKRFWNYSKI